MNRIHDYNINRSCQTEGKKSVQRKKMQWPDAIWHPDALSHNMKALPSFTSLQLIIAIGANVNVKEMKIPNQNETAKECAK